MFRKTINLFLSFIVIVSLLFGTTTQVLADENVQISIKADPKIDVALAVGNNSWSLSNFNQDLLSRLAKKGINTEHIQIQSVQTSTVSSKDADAATIFNSWQKYPLNSGDIFKANWQLSGDEIYTTANVHWTGFWDSTKQQTTNQTIQFSTMSTDHDPWGFTFRMKQTGSDSYSFYALEWDPNHKILALAKITNWTPSASDPMHGGPLYHGVVNASDGYYTGSYYENGYGGSLSNASGKILSRVPYAVTSGQWDNAKIIANGNNTQVWVNGTKYIDYTDTSSPFLQGSYGPYAASNPNSHFKNVSITTETAKKFTEVIRQPIWREGSNRFLVNLENNVVSDLDDAQASAEILTRMISNEVSYVGLGTTTNQTQVERLVTRNNVNGTFINNNVYSSAMDQLADYIASKVRKVGNEHYMILDEDNHLEVNPFSLQKNTQTADYPEGRWKIEHDSTYFENGSGQALWSGNWQKDLPLTFDKPGRYELWFGTDHPNPQFLYVHRRPVADFALKVTKGSANYSIDVKDRSYDPDKESSSNKGISQTEWKWRETTASTWNDGLIPSSLPVGKDYLLQLRVLDEQGAWSQPVARYVSTGSTALKPIADFKLPTKVTTFKPLNVEEQSYDPGGRVITQKIWSIKKDGKEMYTGSTMIKDFRNFGLGNYTVSLKVLNDSNLWSDTFQRNVTVTEDIAAPTISFSPSKLNWTSEPMDVTLTYYDDSGIASTWYKVSSSEESPSSWDTVGSDIQHVTLNREGQWYIHAKAQDLVGKVTTAVGGPYQIQYRLEKPKLKVNQVTTNSIALGWTLPSTTATDGIQYEIINQTTKEAWTIDYPTDQLTDKKLEAGTEYSYVIKVKNHVSETVGDSFKVVTLPNKVDGIKIEFEDHQSGKATVSFDPVPSATEYIFVLYESSKNGPEKISEQTWREAGTHDIGNLKGGTQYFTSLVAKNESGYSEVVSNGFVSLPSAPGEFKIVQVTDTKVDLNWLPSETATRYHLLRSQQEVYEGTELNYTDEDLKSATAYNYQLAAKNDSGFGDIADLDVLTLPSKVAATVEKVTASSFELSWKAVHGTDKYVVMLKGDPILEIASDQNHAVVRDLEAGTNYELSVVAQNESGQSTPDVLHVRTLPASPTHIAVKDIQETSAVLHWDTMTGADKYKLKLDDQVYEISKPELELEGLVGDQEYSATIQAGNESGYGEVTEFKFVTLPSAPELKVDKVTSNTMTVKWSKKPNATKYKIYDENGESLAETEKLSYTWAKLEAGKMYTFYVSVVNESGEGAKTKVTQQMLSGGWGSTDAELNQVVSISGVTFDSAVVSWKAALGAEQYKIVDAKGNSLGHVATPATSYTVSGLNNSTDYSGWVLIPLNDAGEGISAPIPSFRTLTPYYGGNETVPVKKEEPLQPKQEPSNETQLPVKGTPTFEDIDRSFAKEAILALFEKGIVKGVSDKRFEPERQVTRVEFASMLVRALELQESSDVKLTFEDVQRTAWYAPELAAAVMNGVAHGFSDKEFRPFDMVTREQAAKMISNAAYDHVPTAEVNFKDSNVIASWAKPEVAALTVEKIITGYPDETFKPKRNLTRAECSVLIYRALSVFSK
ncbi:uncharacterized protein DUF1080 [Paenibacillus pabuli]|uniref:Uncharacterized protein DUF1080 n=1 Tax=Paenibacillus pabuli TaxID=1472 RepID=A0ABX9BEV8_9BACL|nr:S-layer homology domain-containing protein [Paenibacillus pabuli]RAI89600.1 uncharacterized protein DUF1080 [Paenibacillus pabuli]